MNPAGQNPQDGVASVSSAGWFPDPWRRYEYRFHNGTTWTADVSSGGSRFVDPLGSGPTAPAPWTTAPLPHSKRDGIATAAMVLGIIGLTISWIPVLFVVGAICAVLGLVFGAVALRRRKSENRSFAITGTVTGGAGIVMVGVGVWTTSIVFDSVDKFENPPPHRVEITQCAISGATLTVGGTIENLGHRASDYRILVGIPDERAIAGQTVAIEVDDVEPGETDTFARTIRTGLASAVGGEPTCPVDDVTGPLPFGIDIDSND